MLELRYGLLDGQVKTLQEVASTMGVTKERVRCIEAKALRKLRHPSHSRPMLAFLGLETVPAPTAPLQEFLDGVVLRGVTGDFSGYGEGLGGPDGI